MTRHVPPPSPAGSDAGPPHHLALPTLLDVARLRAARQPSEHAFTFLLDGEQQTADYTYRGLEQRAQAIAAELQRRLADAAGRRALVVLEPGLDYIAALFGCLYAGVVPVPVYPPDPFRIARTMPRLQAVFGSAECELLISTDEILGGPGGALRKTCPAGAVAIEKIADDQAGDYRPVAASPDDLALLQYTSGTTGEPRGVPITHANLVDNLRGMERVLDVPDAVVLQWLPPYHDLGLIGGVFLPLFAGRRSVLMSPLSFMQSPARWLRAISHYRATTSAAPNFGYEHCLRKVTDADCRGLDLSRWRVAVSGAEPVRADTLDRFAERFEPYGFRREAFVPAYGMAETTLMVSVAGLDTPPSETRLDPAALAESRVVPERDGRRLVGCGRAGPGVEIRVVDPHSCEETAGVGEVWVRGPSVASGYWRSPGDSSDRFNQSLAGADETGFLRTGDLGFLDRGELYLVGRRKEMIILAGRNYYPQDIELAVQSSHQAFKVDGGAASAVEIDNAERLVLLQEVQRPRRHDLDELLLAARRAAAEETGQEPWRVVLLPVGELPKTSSGKTRRAESWDLLGAGSLTVLADWSAEQPAAAARPAEFAAPEGPTEVWLAGCWSEVLGVVEVGRDDNFFALGGRSLQVTQMLSAIAEQTGLTLPLRTLFDHPSLAALAAHVDSQAVSGGADQTASGAAWIDPAEPHALTPSQQRFWMVEQFGVEGGANVPVALQLDRPIAPARLQTAVDQLVQRHGLLRHRFFAEGGAANQQEVACDAPRVEQWRLPDGDRSTAIDRALDNRWVWRPFDLSAPPLMRVALVEVAGGPPILLMVLHHLVCDGSSVGVLLDELAAIDRGDVLPDPPPPCGVGEESEPDRSYWAERLAGAPATLELPLDRNHGQQAAGEASVVSRTLDGDLVAAVDRVAKRLGATPFLVYLLALQVVLARYSSQACIGVGTAVAGRRGPGRQRSVGCFINTVPLFAEIGDGSYAHLLRRLRDDVLADLDHAGLPWEAIVEAADKPRAPGRMPVVQAFFVHDDRPTPATLLGARVTDAATDYRGLGVFDLSLVVETSRPIARVQLVHDATRLDPRLADNLLRSLLDTLGVVVERPEAPVAEAPIPGRAESAELRLGGEPPDSPSGASPDDVSRMLSDQARRTPDAVAAACGGVELTFAGLDRRSAGIAAQLAARGVGPGDRVGLMLHRSIDAPAVMMAAWRLGAAYVPLDPAYPPTRLAFMAEDARLACLVASDDLVAQAPAAGCPRLPLSELLVPTDARPAASDGLAGDRIAYVIYTSGSTGRPKGVMLPHRAVANLLASFADGAGMGPGDAMLASTTFSFDISVLELFLPLVTGAKLVLADSKTAGDAARLGRLLRETPVTHLQGAPSTFRMLLATGWRPAVNQTVFCGGEELTPDVAEPLLDTAAAVWNVYGPTETTVWSTYHRLDTVDGAIPLGRPIARTRCYILDERGRMAPTGAWGELAIAGAGVAEGYWDRPELTAERFPADPFSGRPGERMYLTGDTARWNADGLLEFGGRVDGQVKVRGHRVELREIELALASHAAVGEAAVIAADQGAEGSRLLAYVTRANGHRWTPAELQEHLAGRLPSYMAPSAFIELDRLPKTDNGKIDRNRLPSDPDAGVARSVATVAPRTPLERRLADWVEELLRVENVGVFDNFFELGGQSLLATQLVVRVRDELGVEPPLRDVYERPTIADWAALILRHQLDSHEQIPVDVLDRLESMTDDEAAEYLRAFEEA